MRWIGRPTLGGKIEGQLPNNGSDASPPLPTHAVEDASRAAFGRRALLCGDDSFGWGGFMRRLAWGITVITAVGDVACVNDQVLVGDSVAGSEDGEAPAGEASEGGEASAGEAGDDAESSATASAGTGSGGLDSLSSGESGADEGDLPLDVHLAFEGMPTYSRFVRLTHDQWDSAARDLLRLEAAPGVAAAFSGDGRNGRFSNNEKDLSVSNALAFDYQQAAETLAAQVADNPEGLARVVAGTADGDSFVAQFGRRAFRRPLTPTELERFTNLFERGAELVGSGDEFVDGVRLVIESMLQSPHFVYRTELGPEDARLSGYELATKVSMLLHQTIPSDAMLDAADAGELDSRPGYELHVRQLLEAPQTVRAAQDFHGELFHIDRYQQITKDPEAFPTFNEALIPFLRSADLLFFEHVFADDLGVRGLLLSSRAYVNEATAPFYGLSAVGPDFQAVELDDARPGYFTRLGFLASHATMVDPNPIDRGRRLNTDVLCSSLSPVPGHVTLVPPPDPTWTNRQRVEAFTGEGTCGAGCHTQYINPLGFAFENFDAVGVLRETDNGRAVDTQSTYTFPDGPQSFANAPELLELIAESHQAHACYAKHLAEYMLARDITEGDLVQTLELASQSLADRSLQDLMFTLLSSPAFTTRNGGPQ